MSAQPQTPTTETPPYDAIIQGYVNDLTMANHRAIQAEAHVQVLRAELAELKKQIATKDS